MRCLRFLLLGLASVYPLYWVAQFALFFVPETAIGYWLGDPVKVLGVSYLQATAVVRPQAVFPLQWEGLAAAIFFAGLILGLRGDRFITGSFAIVVLGQAALLPFVNIVLTVPGLPIDVIGGGAAAFGISAAGMYRILRCTGGCDFYERMALLSLIALLPEAALWMVLRAAYPFFDTRFLLVLLLPLYLAAIVASLLPANLSDPALDRALIGVPWTEILASSVVAFLLILALSLSSYNGELLNSQTNDQSVPLVDSR